MGNAVDNIGFGCVGLTAQPTLNKAIRLLETAFGQGIRLFDTAPLYGRGYSEKILGKFIRDKRNEVAITTKFGLGDLAVPSIPPAIILPLNFLKKKATSGKQHKLAPVSGDHPNALQPRSLNAAVVRKYFESSLERLRTNYIDNYLLHEGIPSFLEDEALKYLIELREKGYIKRLGLACSWFYLQDIAKEDLGHWDILQYENGPLYPTDFLKQKFPEQTHIYHSALKGLGGGNQPTEKAGAILAGAIKKNPDGKVLFSTSSVNRIIENISVANEFFKDPERLRLMDLSHAIH